MMNIPSIRDSKRLVETYQASHITTDKPAMSETQKSVEINGRYPSWNAVKRVISINKATSRRFCCLSLFTLFFVTYPLAQIAIVLQIEYRSTSFTRIN